MMPEERKERSEEHPMRLHSDMAWRIANMYSHVLASETRDLAAWIDKVHRDARNEALETAAKIADTEKVNCQAHGDTYAAADQGIVMGQVGAAARIAADIRNLKTDSTP